jgi:hypothetical protein
MGYTTNQLAIMIRELESIECSGIQTAKARDEVVKWLYDSHASMGRPEYVPQGWGENEIFDEIQHRIVILAAVHYFDKKIVSCCDRVLKILCEDSCTIEEWLAEEDSSRCASPKTS